VKVLNALDWHVVFACSGSPGLPLRLGHVEAIPAGYVLNQFEALEVVEIDAKLMVLRVYRFLYRVCGLGLVVAFNLAGA
jgi:hypothetical protein